MMPVAVAAVSSPAPAQSIPADTAASADFMALLLLLMGVGTGTPQPEGQTSSEHPDGDAEGATELTAPEPARHAVAAPTAAVTTPALGVAAEISAAPLLRRADVEVDTAGAMPAPAPLAAIETGSVERPAAGPRRASKPEVDAAPVAVEAPTAHLAMPAEPSAQHADVTAPAGQGAHEAGHGGRARPTQHGLRELEPVEEESSAAAIQQAATQAPAAGKLAIAPAGLGEGATGQGGHDAGARGERQSDGLGNSPVPTGPAAVLHGAAASATFLREGHRAEAPASPAPVVEPRAVAEQIVRAARVVVSGDEAEMHVQLDPPALGGVHVTAGARGSAVEITISADRPETHALLTRALPEIQQTLADRGLGSASISVVTTPTAGDGRRAPDRRPPEPRERPITHPNDRRRTPSASRRVSALDITI